MPRKAAEWRQAMFCNQCGAALVENAKFCIACGAPVASMGASEAPMPPQPQPPADYRALTEQLANFVSLTLDDDETLKPLEEQLLAGSGKARGVIVDYLLFCASGRQREGWWHGASRLVRLIPRFGLDDGEQALTRLVDQPSNIWEYETQVKNVARELLSAESREKERELEPAPSTAEKIDRSITPELKEALEGQDTIAKYKCIGFGMMIEVKPDGVLIAGRYFIPFADIQEVVLLPVLESGPSMGGCLKLVTADNPDLPIRDSHSFHMPGQRDARGAHIGPDNCYWFNSLYTTQCAEVNAKVDEIKQVIEAKVREAREAPGSAAPDAAAAPAVEKGALIPFGTWQGQPLMWRVLDIKDDLALLVTDECLWAKPFHDQGGEATWESCSLRRELNGAFFYQNDAIFSPTEREAIVARTHSNPAAYYQNQRTWEESFGLDCADTTDYVFILSMNEVLTYFGNDGHMKEQDANGYWALEFPYSKGAIAEGLKTGNGLYTRPYWCRNSTRRGQAAVVVAPAFDGIVNLAGYSVASDIPILRPACQIRIRH
jgi:hypothetical protein